MSVIGAVTMPHPPVLLPQVGRGQEKAIQATADACRSAAQQVAAWNPEVLVVISPHTICYADYFHIAPGSGARGDLSAFGAPQVSLEADYDLPFRDELIRQAQADDLRAGTLGQRDPALDHGVLIPLTFLRNAGVRCPMVRLGLSGFSPLEHYRLGQCIGRTAAKLDRRTVILASGDLSHKLREDGPYGFAPEGPVFDRAAAAALESADFLSLLTLDPGLCQRAAECGLGSFQIMAGALDGLAVEPKLLSYEGPFGVGYGVSTFTVTGPDESRCFAAPCIAHRDRAIQARKAAEDPWVRLARLALEHCIRSGHSLTEPPEGLPAAMTSQAAGTFVSLHKSGQLRGCIGTISPVMPSVAWEIMRNAVSAGTEDPRFPPVEPEELDLLEYSVDVLGQPEDISGPEDLDVRRYGVIVTSGTRRGLLLPDLDGVDTVADQLSIARRKAGIGPGEPVQLQRFEVIRHT